MAGEEASLDPETSSEPDTSSEPEAYLECVADPKGVPVSMHSFLDSEALIISGATFVGVSLVVPTACAGVTVPGALIRGHAHRQSQ